MQTEEPGPFWAQTAQYWFNKTGSSPEGLSQEVAAKRLNETNTGKPSASGFKKDFILLLRQFNNPLMLLLIGAIILSALLGDNSDVAIILFIVITTGTLSFIQERNAGKVVEKLQKLIGLTCVVQREGKRMETVPSELVPGDLLLVKAGDMIAADCLIVEANELHVNEAGLTGESYPVRKDTETQKAETALKDRKNCLWQGTSIISGNAKAIVIKTGKDTVFSGIAGSTSSYTETSFEKGIKGFGYMLMRITLFLSFFILVINLVNHKPVIDSALFALTLAVGMAPELLPAITTIAMSAGARRMLDKKVIVKKLSSIQNLGEVNLLCTDKTGTITEGAIEVTRIENGMGEEDAFVRELAWLNASMETGYSNPIDEALKKLDIQPSVPSEKTGEIPYDFVRKRLSIAVKRGNENLLISKGAFNELISLCNTLRFSDGSSRDIREHLPAIKARYTEFGMTGLRVIAIAFTRLNANEVLARDEINLTFAGFIVLQDPIKKGIPETIDSLRKMHVGLKIITGDNRNVARSTALKLGIDNPLILTGSELAKCSNEALTQKVKKVHIFAEVEPQQKEQLIRALRRSYTVAYIGDGINDVSALTAADVGISVENAVDVAREAADFVLMEKELSVLTDGIAEGRKTFANTLKYIFINTGATFGNMFSVAAASLLLPFFPMLPKQILLTNFITDFPYLAMASDNVDADQMKKPGKWNMKLIRNYMIIFGIHSSLFDLLTFLTLLYGLKATETEFQTGWFIESVLSELFILFIIRTHKNFFKSRPGKTLYLLSLAGFILTLILPYSPFATAIGFIAMPLPILGCMLLIVGGYIITADLLKVWFFRKYTSNTH